MPKMPARQYLIKKALILGERIEGLEEKHRKESHRFGGDKASEAERLFTEAVTVVKGGLER